MKGRTNDWNRNVESWVKLIDEHLDPFRKYVLDPFLNQLLTNSFFRGLCLDIGCGEGTTSRLLEREGCDVVAVDLEFEFLTIAMGRSDGVAWAQADATCLPFRESVFDSVISKLVSMNLADYDAFIKEVQRVMRPNARFLEIVTHPCFVTFRGEHGSPNDYLRSSAVKTHFYGEEGTNVEPVTNFHRPLQAYVSCFRRHNLRIVGLHEPPVPSEFVRTPEWRQAGFAGPPFLIIEITRV